MNKDKKIVVLLDVHALLHRAYHAIPDFKTSTGEATGALYGVCNTILKILGDYNPAYIIACYDLPEKTHRHKVYEEYKAGRVKADPELISQIISSYQIFEAFNIPVYHSPGFEADDILGTIVEKEKDENLQLMIASGDMDTMQLVEGERVVVYTLKKGITDIVVYNEKKVVERFGFVPKLLPDYKGLRGDPSDNIIGIKGIGEKTAGVLIAEFGTLENMYESLEKDESKFKKVGITPRIIELIKNNKDEALFSKALATIRRDAPIDFVLPEKTFKDNLEIEKVEKFFENMEFRTLGYKVRGYLEGKNRVATPAVTPALDKEGVGGVLTFDLQLALYVLDSTLTESTSDDLLRITKEKDFEKAKNKLPQIIKEQKLDFVYDKIEVPLTPVIHKIEERGVKIDLKYLNKLGKDYHKTLSDLEKEIYDLVGEEFNISSPKQLGSILFEKLKLEVKGIKKTAGGSISTKESELEKLKDAHPVIDKIMEHRELSKLLGTYIDVIPTLVDDKDRLHTHYVQMSTVTGRLSSLKPNLQNIPIKTPLGQAIRHAFVADTDFKFVSFDYSQFELRIAAFLSGDQKLINIFKEGRDVHSAVASQVFGVEEKDVTSDMRRKAKVINFGILYGMGVTALRGNLGGTKQEAEKFLNDYFATFSSLASFLESVKEKVREVGFTTTLFGRRRYFKDIKSKIPYLRASAERMAINAPIQGTQADIIKLAMIQIDKYVVENNLQDKVYMLLQVHDELDFEIHESVVDKVASKIKEIMQNVLTLEESSGVPVIANAYVGENWGNLQKYI